MVLSPGIRYMLLATFFFACMNVLVKFVSHIPAVEVVFFRSVISLVMSYVVLRIQKVNVWGNNRKWLIARGAFGAVGLILYFTLLQQIPLATAITLQFLAPVATAILGLLLLREKVWTLQWFFFLITFLGMFIISGFEARMEPIHLAMGILAAGGAGMAYTIIRKLNHSEHPLVIVLYFPLVTLPITGLYAAFHWVVPIGTDWLFLLGVGVLTQFAQYFMTKAYQAEEVSKVSNLQYLSIVYALLFGFLFFGETFNLLTYFGMALVIAGVVLNVWYKQKKQAAYAKRQESVA
uniref:DMT family transporter n=1 Tax=Roseihalotalea indica TaxID=2867963 RepID=A0AA49GKP7_9BACT|nr:DMT family transporter [Tunicatimonas sp. TK19036]